MSNQAKVAMQGYLNKFLSNPDIVNSPKVLYGHRSIQLRTKSSGKVVEWASAMNDAGLQPPEGWCHPHHFGSFVRLYRLTKYGSGARWFIEGHTTSNLLLWQD